jgi:cytosine/uracil/thiamine/allantoin permease
MMLFGHEADTGNVQQAYGLFISKPIVILVGMVIASCGNHLYGTAYWVRIILIRRSLFLVLGTFKLTVVLPLPCRTYGTFSARS